MNKHISPKQAMIRHFSENTYKHFDAVFRRVYRLTGDYEKVERVYRCIDNPKHGYYPQGKQRARNAYLTFLCR